MLSLSGRPWQWEPVDVLSGRTRSEAFLALNPNGKVPLLQFPDGRCLPESNAALLHLAEGSDWLPGDAWPRAQVYQWLFFEQYSHEPYIAVARFRRVFTPGEPQDPAAFAVLMERGALALQVMERQLASTSFLVGERPTVADLALFAYTHVAADGGFDLGRFPAIERWLDALRRLPGFFDMANCPR